MIGGMRQVVTVGVGLLWVAAAACALGSLISLEQLRPLGELVRRADDVTPERVARYRHLCLFFALGLTAAAMAAMRRRERIQEFLQGLWRESRPSSEPRRGRRELVLIGIVVLVGALLRLQRLDDPVAYDEAYTYLNFARRPWYEAIGDYNSTNNHMLNTLLMHVSTRVFGPQEWAMRIPVFLAGCALPIAVFGWARTWWPSTSTVDQQASLQSGDAGRFWIAVPLPAAALTAISPLLITYSTDARGYMLIALAAVLFDGLLAEARRAPRPRVWMGAWLALVAGLCAMPLMLYAALPSLLWFVLLPGSPHEAAFMRSLGGRVRPLIPLLGTAALAAATFYAPAYLFRGMLFLHDPILRAEATPHFASRLAECWHAAWDWWTDGVVPEWLWGILVVTGLLTLIRRDRSWVVRWSIPFAVVLAANIVQHVTPPPRIYLHLAPWLFLMAACGMAPAARMLSFRRVDAENCACGALAAFLLIAGTVYAVPKRVLFHVEERTSFVSVPDVIARLEPEIESNPPAPHVLIAPLPCDLPSLFYMNRAGFQVPVNELSEPGTTAWLIARHGETPAEVLRSDLVGMSAEVDRFSDWERVAAFETLDLYRAVKH